MWGKLWETFVIVTSLSRQSDNTDIFLKQPIQFYLTDRQRTDSIGQTVLQMVAQKTKSGFGCVVGTSDLEMDWTYSYSLGQKEKNQILLAAFLTLI